MARPSARDDVWIKLCELIRSTGYSPTPTDLSQEAECAVSTASKYLDQYANVCTRLGVGVDGHGNTHLLQDGLAACSPHLGLSPPVPGKLSGCKHCLERLLGRADDELDELTQPVPEDEAATVKAKAKSKSKKSLVIEGDKLTLATQLLELLDSGREVQIDEDAVRDLAREEIEKAGVGRQVIVVNEVEEQELPAESHRVLGAIIRAYKAGIRNIWLAGPAGTGKTYLARQAARELKLDFGFISGSPGLSESVLLGWFNPVTETYHRSSLVARVEEGGVFLVDEYDNLDDGLRVGLNTLTANGHLAVPFRVDRPVAERHSDFLFIVATNTWGSGSDPLYTARDTIDAASQDRFLCKFWVGYDEALEKKLVGGFLGSRRDVQGEWTCPEVDPELPLQDALQKVRLNVEKHSLRRVPISTRSKLDANRLAEAGYSTQEILTLALTSWTEHERQKALDGVLRKGAS